MQKPHTSFIPDLGKRVLTVAVGAPIVLLCIYFGFPAYHILVIAAAIISVLELYNVIRPGQLGLIVLLSVTLTYLASITAGNVFIPVGMVLITIVVGLTETLLLRRSRWLTLLIGGLYLGIPIGLLLLIRMQPAGLLWTLVLFFNNWFTDGGGLIGGRLAGRRKLVPRISPGKTIEGTLIGFIVGALVGFSLSILFHLPLETALIANLLIAGLTILGDLLESSIKRRFGVKDSGSVLPGHGGMLDRIDGLLLAATGLFLTLVILST